MFGALVRFQLLGMDRPTAFGGIIASGIPLAAITGPAAVPDAHR
jgi:hypothetical protein